MRDKALTKISNINIIVHPTLKGDETRIVCRQNASELPPEVRDDVTFPCIITGGLGMTKSMLTLMVAQTLSEYLGARAESDIAGSMG
jgi:hypothetical protein